MKKRDLIEVASKYYEQIDLMSFVDKEGNFVPGKDRNIGDLLAEFIVAELLDGYHATEPKKMQLAMAIGAMERARMEITSVLDGLVRESTRRKKRREV